VVRSADPKRTFGRDGGSEGQVRNVRVTDETGDIRVALWGEKADRDLGPGDEVFLADVEIQDGWQEDIEASAGFRSTVVRLDGTTAEPPGRAGTETGSGGDRGGSDGTDEATGGGSGAGADSAETGLDAFASGGGGGSDAERSDGEAARSGATAGAELETGTEPGDELEEGSGDVVEFTGTVVQTGNPVMLDDGEETRIVETAADVELGQEVTVRGRRDGDRIEAEDVEPR
jgi:replication factor A1